MTCGQSDVSFIHLIPKLYLGMLTLEKFYIENKKRKSK